MARFLIISCCWLALASALRLEDAEEGSCHGIRYKALPSIDLDFVDALNYMPAGNRYHLYRHASGHPRFREMREFELYYNLCLTQNTTYAVGDGTAFGFGNRPLGSYTVRPRRDQPGVIDTVQIGGGSSSGRLVQYISLTDHRTFALLANCWTDSDQRSWNVFASTSELSPTAKRMIEEHVVSLGYDRDQVVFLNYDNCGDDPLPEDRHAEIGGGGERYPAKPYGFGFHKKSNYGSKQVSYAESAPIPQSNGGKLVTSRATINPSLGNNSLRRASTTSTGGGGLSSGKLSLANTGVGWTRD